MAYDQVVEWSLAMVPILLHRACEAERLRELPQVTIDDALAAGLFKMVVPAELGGLGLGLPSLAQPTRGHRRYREPWAKAHRVRFQTGPPPAHVFAELSTWADGPTTQVDIFPKTSFGPARACLWLSPTA